MRKAGPTFSHVAPGLVPNTGMHPRAGLLGTAATGLETSMAESLFGRVEAFAGDPILSLNDSFKADPRADKVNLSIGVYTDENGRIPALGSVKAAHERTGFAERPYLPM